MDFNTLSKLVMIEQTLFALPFALIGVLFAGGGSFSTWVLVILALFFARTAGMAFNRVIDADIDKENPRTQDRLIPSGELSKRSGWMVSVIFSILLILTAKMLNPLCYHLSFAAVLLLFTYSYFKRFSQTSHFYLGLVEAAAPIGGYLAVTGSFSIVAILLGLVILFWIAGLDIVYALQDMEFDKNHNLFSIPAKYGREKALFISRCAYGLSILTLLLCGWMTEKGLLFYSGVFIIGLIFIYQQKLALEPDLKSSIQQFFRVNMFISPILFFSTLLDMLNFF